MRIQSLLLILDIIYSTYGARQPKITPPKRLSSGETPIQEPGWKHCLTNVKAISAWKKILSPGYPILPPTQMQCSWIIEAPIGWRVKVSFKDLDMSGPFGPPQSSSCRSAYVDIIDMEAQKSQGRFCGKKPPGDYVSIKSFIRIDLQGDKSTTRHRGFSIQYKIVKEMPGFRAPRALPSPSNSAPGKVNFNEFKSTQQRIISSAGATRPRPPPPARNLVYASDVKDASPRSTTARPNSGWEGDDGQALGPITQQTPRTVGGARFTPRTPRAQRTTTKSSSSGNRITAIDQRPANTNNNNQRIQDNSAGNDGWVDGGVDGEQTDNNEPRFYGEKNQPGGMKQNRTPPPRKNNYIVVHNDGGLSTTHLIIIIVAVLACVIIVVAIFVIKRCYFDKRLKRLKNKKKEEEEKEENIEMENPYATNHATSLPGFSRAGSVRSINSRVSFHPNVEDNEDRAERLSVHHQIPLPSVTSQTHPHRGMTRHQSLVAQHDAIYRNHHVMTMHARHNGHQRHPSHHRRSHDVSVQRPLPPVPKLNDVTKAADIDEDYCSGSDEDADVTTLRREYSKWELDEKKRNKFRDKYM